MLEVFDIGLKVNVPGALWYLLPTSIFPGLIKPLALTSIVSL